MSTQLAQLLDVADKTFDFVIVGGGTGGLALANRLSENPNVTVAVLEAGKAHIKDPLILAPAGWPRQFLQPEYDWKFTTVPQAHAKQNSYVWTRGKGLGGTSAINAMLWTRPQKEEIDAFQRLGNPGWAWNDMRQYLHRAERFTAPSPTQKEYKAVYNPDSLGTNGPVDISFTQVDTGVEIAVQKTLELFGVTVSNDCMNGETKGTWKAISSIDPQTGTRSYAVNAYLLPVIHRRNLVVLAEAYVHRIILTKKNDTVTATGVEFEYGGKINKVFAEKEVLLSAGTVKSPHILELSGIGDRKILEPLGIPTYQDLPGVGTNVQDHINCPRLSFELRTDMNILTGNMVLGAQPPDNSSDIRLSPDDPLSLAMSGLTFLPLDAFMQDSASIIKKQKNKLKAEAADLPPGLREQYEVQLEFLQNKEIPQIELYVWPFSRAAKEKPYISLTPSIIHPFSRGTIHVTSADPHEPPAIDPHYLEEDVDMELLLEAVKFTRKLSQTEPFSNMVVREDLPGPNVKTDEQLREHILKNLYPSFHAAGSLSMLPLECGGAVDSNLKVYGTRNIRVVDLSVVPLLFGAHPQSVVYGIAEKAADIIKEQYGL